MKENTKKILSLIFYSFIAFVITNSFYVAIFQISSENLIILGMLIAGIIVTDFFILNYKKSKYYVLIYAFSLIYIYLVGAFLYTYPFLALTFNCSGNFNYIFLLMPNHFMTNHFHILHTTNIFTYYNGIYIPYNVSIYEPVYSMFPFQTNLNLVNQTIILKIVAENHTIKAKYKVISENIINLKQYLLKRINSYYYQDSGYNNFVYVNSFSSSPVYLLNLTAEITNPKIIDMAKFNWNNQSAVSYYTKLTGWVVSAEYNGITIT